MGAAPSMGACLILKYSNEAGISIRTGHMRHSLRPPDQLGFGDSTKHSRRRFTDRGSKEKYFCGIFMLHQKGFLQKSEKVALEVAPGIFFKKTLAAEMALSSKW